MAIYKINDRFFNTLTRTIADDKGNIRKLSKSEVYLLAYLIENQGKVLDKNDLMRVGWPKKIVVVNSLTVAISNLRKALEDPDAISSNKGIGYTLSLRVPIVHDISDEMTDEIIVESYNMPIIQKKKSPVLDAIIYLSVFVGIGAMFFANNWFSAYVMNP